MEINAQKLMELEIPIMQMEQKIERLENEVLRINTDISESAIRTVCARIND